MTPQTAEERREAEAMEPGLDATPDPAPIAIITAPRLEEDDSHIVDEAMDLTVRSAEDEAKAAGFLAKLDERIKLIKSKFAPPKKAAHEAHKSVVALEKEALQPYERAREDLTRGLNDYRAEQRRKAEEARRRQEEERRQREEAERKRLEEERLKRAEELEAQGKHTAADKVLEEEIEVPPAVEPEPPAAVVPKAPEGIAYAETWKGEVVDEDSFFELLRDKRDARRFVKIDQAELNRAARQFKHSNPYEKDGIRFYADEKVRRA